MYAVVDVFEDQEVSSANIVDNIADHVQVVLFAVFVLLEGASVNGYYLPLDVLLAELVAD